MLKTKRIDLKLYLNIVVATLIKTQGCLKHLKRIQISRRFCLLISNLLELGYNLARAHLLHKHKAPYRTLELKTSTKKVTLKVFAFLHFKHSSK